MPYEKVRGSGFYRQFIDSSEWPGFMRSGRAAGLKALGSLSRARHAGEPAGHVS